jgi:uncharacterized membrane protein YfcA
LGRRFVLILAAHEPDDPQPFLCGSLLGLDSLFLRRSGGGVWLHRCDGPVWVTPGTIKPTALVLNVLVSALVAFRFFPAGHLDWRTFWPLAIASAPAALLGGYLTLPPLFFNRLLGTLLVLAAPPLFFRKDFAETATQPPGPVAASLAGSGIGLVSGLTGVGGGVLITPILLYCRWATGKRAAAISAVFILVNSIAALTGHFSATHNLPPGLPLFALSALAGGAIGSQMGSVHLSNLAIYRILGAILLLAGLKLCFT